VTSKNAVKASKPTSKQLEYSYYALDFNAYSPDSDIVNTLGIDTSDYARFTCNHVMFCDVLSVVEADNAIALMSRDINTSEDALQFLNDQGLNHLIKDKSWETNELLTRRIRPLSYAEITAKGRGEQSTPSQIIDAAEAHSTTALRDWQRYPSVPIRILDGAINLADIKEIGATRMIRADPKGDALIQALARINNGDVDFNAADLKSLIKTFYDETAEIYDMDKLLGMSYSYGIDFTRDLFNPDYAFRLSSHLNRPRAPQRRNALEEKLIIAYGDKMCRYQSEHGFQIGSAYSEVEQLWEAGVDYRDAAKGLREGYSVNQIAAIHKESIAPSISGGWL